MRPEPPLEEHLWTIAAARLIFGPSMSIQAPPNLRADELEPLVRAGINDWGGVSPVTPDHVNPEAPWPQIAALAHGDEAPAVGSPSAWRLSRPTRMRRSAGWMRSLQTAVLRTSDSPGWRERMRWHAGQGHGLPPSAAGWVKRGRAAAHGDRARSRRCCERAGAGERAVGVTRSQRCSTRRGRDLHRRAGRGRPIARRDGGRRRHLRRQPQHQLHEHLHAPLRLLRVRQRPQRARACAARPTTSTPKTSPIARSRRGSAGPPRSACRAASIRSTPATPTSDIVEAVKRAVPQNARARVLAARDAATARSRSASSLARLPDATCKSAGLATLPGTAAEILDDEVRAVICPDKLSTASGSRSCAKRTRVGLRTTATIMFGHVDQPVHWARHLLRVRAPAGTRRAASPSSCRCRSCTWRRRCGAGARRVRARRCARPC